MLYLLKLFPEISIKSRPVRRQQTRQLRKNIRAVIKEFDAAVQVAGDWDSIEVETTVTVPEVLAQILERLCTTPGISLVLEVSKHPLPDLQGMLDLTMDSYAQRLAGKTFAVRCKRQGKHDFSSVDIERFVGAGLNQNTAAAGVNLTAPEVTVQLEVRHQDFYVVRQQARGLGGFPLGCQDSVLSLISGGFDSSVSSYLCIRRGLQTHYCFFNLGGKAHELAVKEVALYLWMKYHSSHRVKFVSVPFEDVVSEILDRVDNAQMGVVLKRMMLRAAEKIAEELEIKALVTGESVAQVSSQTLTNLSVIDTATDKLVLRPLVTTDKQAIIDLAREIGSEEFSRNIPEYCAVISRNPTTRAKPERVAREEARINMDVLATAVANARYQLITEVMEDFGEQAAEVAIVQAIGPQDTVVDIRHPHEVELSPFQPIPGADYTLLNIPFYELRSSYERLVDKPRVLLYCDRGMMSRLHAANLQDEGLRNVAVLDLRPAQKIAS